MITVVLKSAEMARVETEPNRLQREIEEFEKRKQAEETHEKNIAEVIEQIKDWIDREIEYGNHSLHKTIYRNDRIYKLLTANDYYWWTDSTLDPIIKVFEEAGYSISFYKYSHSWQQRSGKVGNLYIYWGKE